MPRPCGIRSSAGDCTGGENPSAFWQNIVFFSWAGKYIWCAPTSSQFLQVQSSSFPLNLHCWLCHYPLWRVVRVRSLLQMCQMMPFLAQILVLEVMTECRLCSFSCGPVIWTGPKLTSWHFTIFGEILHRIWQLGAICIFSIMPFLRETGGQDWRISVLSISLWVKNLIMWSKEQQELPAEGNLCVEDKASESKVYCTAFFYTAGSFQEGGIICGTT